MTYVSNFSRPTTFTSLRCFPEVASVWQHAYTIYQHAICTCNMPSCRHNCMMKCMHTTATWHSPTSTSTRGFSCITPWGKDFEVAEKPSSLENKCKGQMGEPLPACQGPWGMLHQISRLYTRLAVPKGYRYDR